MAKHKPLKDLNLLDRFLFAEAMDDPVVMQCVLEIILGKEVVLKHLPQTEKEQRSASFSRFVRLDVWAWDDEDTVYDTEVQKEDTRNLPKRSRLYQGMIDSNLLEPGEVEFNNLNKVYIIMITPFDLFGQGRYQYTFRMRCDEDRDVALGDDGIRIFLNTRGTNSEGVNPELIDLLHYIENTSESVSNSSDSQRIKRMQERIATIKSSEEIGVKYMQEWEEKIIEKKKAKEAGREEVNLLIQKLTEAGRTDDIIKAATDARYQEQLLQEFGIELD